MNYKVPFIKPTFPSAELLVKDYEDILAANWFTNFGPFERRFAKKIGEYISDEHTAVTFSSATSALIAAMLAILGKGDNSRYILMPAFTFAAGAHCLEWCGYKPLFVDIEKEGFHMDVQLAEDVLRDGKYGGKIAGILFCNSFGVGSTDIEKWDNLAKRFSLPLIIDSAAGFGSRYSTDRKVGNAGLCEIFSFHATKPFAIGEGGAAVTRDKKLAAQLISIQNFGFDESKNITSLGFNGKLEELSAAIGLRQFERLDKILSSRKEVFKQYADNLDTARYALQKNAELASLCFAAVLVRDGNRESYLSRLLEAGVEAKKYYSPTLNQSEYFKDCEIASPLTNTDFVAKSILSLPIHDNMDKKDISLILKILNS